MNMVPTKDVEAKIKKITFTVSESKKQTICFLTLENGFEVTGIAGVVDPANYDKQIGERYAYNRAFDKVRHLEGYLLQERRHIEFLNPHLSYTTVRRNDEGAVISRETSEPSDPRFDAWIDPEQKN